MYWDTILFVSSKCPNIWVPLQNYPQKKTETLRRRGRVLVAGPLIDWVVDRARPVVAWYPARRVNFTSVDLVAEFINDCFILGVRESRSPTTIVCLVRYVVDVMTAFNGVQHCFLVPFATGVYLAAKGEARWLELNYLLYGFQTL